MHFTWVTGAVVGVTGRHFQWVGAVWSREASPAEPSGVFCRGRGAKEMVGSSPWQEELWPGWALLSRARCRSPAQTLGPALSAIKGEDSTSPFLASY